MKGQETRGFQSEVKQLLHLMIHSLYSNKEIFLRELISNASDAADKLRFRALSQPDLYEGDGELRVRVSFDKDNRTLTIADNGIGMNREEVIDHLGTIAKSGTADFLKNLSGDQKKDSHLIGQFGVGFYSAFIVADQVEVFTRRAGLAAAEGVYWSSKGEGEFEVANVEKAERGTRIVLHLKSGEEEFADGWRLRNIVKKYSDHIALPIELPKEHYGEEKDKPAEVEWETVNRASALWTRPRTEVKDEEYQEFYKHVAHDFENPLTWSHNKVEGKLEYTSLLYVPGRAPFDLYHREAPKGLKLYVQRVFIMDQADQFLPLYLRFIKGVVDSNDLSLNVSREILQSGPVIDSMKSALTKRVLDMLEKLAKDKPEDYKKFWSQFGQVLKEGPAEDFANKEKIAGLLRFASTHEAGGGQKVSLADYVSRMKPNQEAIYILVGDDTEALKVPGVLAATVNLASEAARVRVVSGAVAPAALIQAGRSGTARRLMRYYSGDGLERPIDFTCRIGPGPNAGVMVEDCEGHGLSFQNSYLPSAGVSRQWIGPGLGYATIQVLRD